MTKIYSKEFYFKKINRVMIDNKIPHTFDIQKFQKIK